MKRSATPLLKNRNFILLFCAYGISAFGDHLSELGIMESMGIEEGVEKTRIGAQILFFFFLPYVLLGPLAGAIADRLPRRMIMITTDVCRGLIVLSIPWYFKLIEDRTSTLMIMPILAVGVFASVFNPARQAFVPQIVADKSLTRANSLLNGLAPIASIFSYVVGAWLVGHSLVMETFFTDAATFGISALLVAGIILPKVAPAEPPQQRLIIEDIIIGVRYIREHRLVWQLMIFTATFWFAAGVFPSVLPVVVFDWYHLGIEEFGYMRATLGCGMMAGSVVLAIVGDASRPHYNIIVSLLGAGTMLLLFTLTHNPWLGVVLSIGVGFFGVWILITAYTMIQRIVPDNVRGKVFGILALLNTSGTLLGTGILGDPFHVIPVNLDPYAGWILGGLAALLFGMGVFVWVYHARRAPDHPVVGLCRCLNEVLCKFWYRQQRDGICTVPPEGACILTANHTCSVDPCFLAAASPHRLFSFMIAREYYNIPIWRYLIHKLECIPVRRDGKDMAATKEALRHLREGKALCVFIQGRIVGPGQAGEPRDGVATLALRSGTKVIPAHISGVNYRAGIVAPFFIRHRVRVKFGPPVDLSEFSKDRKQIEKATQRIWKAIQDLAPEDGTLFLNENMPGREFK